MSGIHTPPDLNPYDRDPDANDGVWIVQPGDSGDWYGPFGTDSEAIRWAITYASDWPGWFVTTLHRPEDYPGAQSPPPDPDEHQLELEYEADLLARFPDRDDLHLQHDLIGHHVEVEAADPPVDPEIPPVSRLHRGLRRGVLVLRHALGLR